MKNRNQFLVSFGLVFLMLMSASVGHTQTSRADIVLIIDSSGSMDDNDPNDLRKDAAKFFIGLADSDVQIAIVDFDDSAATLTRLTFANATGKTNLKRAVDRVNSDGGTDLNAGLREGFNTLNRSQFPNTKKAAVMLTDGDDNSSTRQTVSSYASKNWSIYTIGLGSGVDRAKLETIAGSTPEGEYFPITIDNMQTVYQKILGTILEEPEIYKDKGYLNKGQKVTKFTPLDDSITKAKFTVYHEQGRRIDMKVKDPSGFVITPQVASRTTGIDHEVGDTFSIYIIDKPKTGKYDMELTGTTLPNQGGKYDLAVTGTSDFITKFLLFNPSYSVGDTINIGVQIKEKIGNMTRVVSGASTSTEVVRPDGQIETLNLAYQGNGVYSNTYRNVNRQGPYQVRVAMNSGGLTRKIQSTVIVGPIENVFIDGGTLIPAAGETLTQPPSVISAVISGPTGRINSNSIVLKVNGRTVSHTYDSVNQLVSYRPGRLSAGSHNVRLTVRDVASNTIETRWAFTLRASSAQSNIYWSVWSQNKIQRANLDGSNVQNLVTTTEPEGLTLDIAGGKMYWTSASPARIQRANLDGSNVQNLVTSGLRDPEGIALDIAGGKMYWTDFESEKIQRANLDGSNVQTLVTNIQGLISPRRIALDVANRKMYWTDSDTQKIQRANLDGSNIQDLVTRLGSPTGIALDAASGKIYWTDTDTDRIQRANLDGSNVQTLVTGLPAPFSITLDVAGGKMYWTDVATHKIQRANLDGSNVQNIITTGLVNPAGITLLIDSSTPPPAINPADVNRDGVVDVSDLVIVATHFGQRVLWRHVAPRPDGSVPSANDSDGHRADVNKDGIVNRADIIAVLDALEGAAAPNRHHTGQTLTAESLQRWIDRAKKLSNTDPSFQKGIAILEELLGTLITGETVPTVTQLLPNYPNPFNPETWIPYQLSEPSEVTLTIYTTDGRLVRTLVLGNQAAGAYQSKARAAYWDGTNEQGERVASGLYFYTLTAGDFSATRKMLILK